MIKFRFILDSKTEYTVLDNREQAIGYAQALRDFRCESVKVEKFDEEAGEWRWVASLSKLSRDVVA